MSKNRSVLQPQPPRSAPDAPNTDLHRVREILFGELERQTAERIAALEERIEEQAAAIKDLGGALRSEVGAVEQRLAGALADASSGDRESRDALREELLAELATVRDQKLDREALAGLLGGLADRLGKSVKDAG